MIEVFDRERNRTAILDNAYGIQEDKKLNSLCYFTFTLPYNDPKNEYCKPYHYIRHDGSELYRIMPITVAIEETGGVTYQCEHVLATLLDNVLYGYHVIGNIGVYTDDVIRYILARQNTGNWELDSCDFRYQFEYGFENENLLSALFSVFAPFAEPCKLETNTKTYPWRLSIKRLQTTGTPDRYIRYRHNMTRFQQNQDPERVCTRIYPLGYGEGINQLTIKEVNNGIPYLQSPPEIIAKYGLIEKVWIDRRYADAETLKAVASSILRNIQTPEVSYEIEYIDNAEPGQRIRIIYPDSKEYVDTYITEVSQNFDDITQSSITISNRDVSISSKISELAEKQWIAENYAQGATNVYCQSLQANCDGNSAASLNFIIPSELKIVNRVFAKVRIKPFRAYSKTTSYYDSGPQQTGSTEYQYGLKSSSFTDPSTETSYDEHNNFYEMAKNFNEVLTQDQLVGEWLVDSSFFPYSVLPDAFIPNSIPPQINGPFCVGCGAIDVKFTAGYHEFKQATVYTAEYIPGKTEMQAFQYFWVKVTGDLSKLPSGASGYNVLGMFVDIGVGYFDPPILGVYRDRDLANNRIEILILSPRPSPPIPKNMPITIRKAKPESGGDEEKEETEDRYDYEFRIVEHVHTFTTTEHVHTFTYPAHDHDFELQAHEHDISPGIYEFGNPKSFSILIDGKKRATYAETTAELDITNFLVGTDGKIPRDKWFEFAVLPDGLSYACITLVVQGFIQSRGENANA